MGNWYINVGHVFLQLPVSVGVGNNLGCIGFAAVFAVAAGSRPTHSALQLVPAVGLSKDPSLKPKNPESYNGPPTKGSSELFKVD